MSSYTVQFSPLSETDLTDTWFQIAEQNFYAADAFIEAIRMRANKLSQFPERGAPRDDLMPNLRMLVEGKYLIFYRVSNSDVEILRVLHGAMDLTQAFSASGDQIGTI
jgi:toxin ParE1/3/4